MHADLVVSGSDGMDSRKDAGIVLWGVESERWWTFCQVRSCGWKSSHESASVAVDAMRRHLVKAHIAERTDLRTDRLAQ